MSTYSETQAKADADALVAKLEADPALRAALLEDPHGTLIAEGLPADTVAVLESALLGDDVEGFTMAPNPLDGGAHMTTQFVTLQHVEGLAQVAGSVRVFCNANEPVFEDAAEVEGLGRSLSPDRAGIRPVLHGVTIAPPTSPPDPLHRADLVG
jgi:hypothetical protein